MTEDEAREQTRELVGDAAMIRLEHFAALVIDENTRQNLIARSTVPSIWARHIFDSVQLSRWAPQGSWMDVGSGGGFPGLAIAIAAQRPITLVEPRRRRAEFLRHAALQLGSETNVIQSPVERMTAPSADIISARAVSDIGSVFAAAAGCAHPRTTWILPRGVNHLEDIEAARRGWHGLFHVEHSRSDPAAGIVIVTGVKPR